MICILLLCTNPIFTTDTTAIAELSIGGTLGFASLIVAYCLVSDFIKKKHVPEKLAHLPTQTQKPEKQYVCDGYYVPTSIVFLVCIGVCIGATIDGAMRLQN